MNKISWWNFVAWIVKTTKKLVDINFRSFFVVFSLFCFVSFRFVVMGNVLFTNIVKNEYAWSWTTYIFSCFAKFANGSERLSFLPIERFIFFEKREI